MCPALNHPRSVSFSEAHVAHDHGEGVWPGPSDDCFAARQLPRPVLCRGPLVSLVLEWLWSTHGGHLRHCRPGTHNCYPWFHCQRPRRQRSSRLNGGSLWWKGRAELFQNSYRHSKWSRRLLSYHLEKLLFEDCCPSGQGGVTVNYHSVSKQMKRQCVIQYGRLNGPRGFKHCTRIWSDHHKQHRLDVPLLIWAQAAVKAKEKKAITLIMASIFIFKIIICLTNVDRI